MFLNRYATAFAFALLGLASASQDAQAFNEDATTFLQGTQEQITQTATFKESLSQADANNFAVARADAAAGTVGVAVATGVAQSIAAGAFLTEPWNCLVGCASQGSLNFQVALEGTLGPNVPDEGPNNGFSGDFTVLGRTADNLAYSISLDFAWNGSSLSGFECWSTLGGSQCDPLTVPVERLADGGSTFRALLDISSCKSGQFISCGISGSFSTSLSLSADFDPAPGPLSIDALNTFGFNIYATNPSDVWASDSGRTSIVAVSAVPEPGSALLLAVSLGGMVLLRRGARGTNCG